MFHTSEMQQPSRLLAGAFGTPRHRGGVPGVPVLELVGTGRQTVFHGSGGGVPWVVPSNQLVSQWRNTGTSGTPIRGLKTKRYADRAHRGSRHSPNRSTEGRPIIYGSALGTFTTRRDKTAPSPCGGKNDKCGPVVEIPPCVAARGAADHCAAASSGTRRLLWSPLHVSTDQVTALPTCRNS